MKDTIVLGVAAGLVSGSRNRDYGHPRVNHERIARLWSARLHDILSRPLTPEEVASLMRLAKEARLIESPGHVDSLVDIAGYAEVEAMIHEDRGATTSA